MPDFRNEVSHSQVAQDYWSPWPDDAGPDQSLPSIRGFLQPTAESLAFAKEIWAQQGYHEQ